jgi:hypothetical protein
MKRFSKISIDDIKSIQVDSGVLLKEFDVENPVFLPENVICATSGGINPVCTPEYYDFGEDVDNAKSAKETKRIRGWNVSISFTTFTASLTLIRLALGAADISGKVLSLRQRLQYAKDFNDIWWVGKRADDKLIAIRLIRSLSDSGFSLQTNKRGKGQISVTLKGHSSFAEKDKIPMEIYVLTENDSPDVPAASLYLYGTPSTTGNIGLRNGESVTLYDGAVLPPLPEWDKEKYPYALLAVYKWLNETMNAQLVCYSEKAETGYNDDGDIADWVEINGTRIEFLVNYPINTIPTDWGEPNEYTGSANRSGIWSNTDIVLDDGTLYLSASEPIPVTDIVGYSYNGTVLPPLPEWDKTVYPYAVILHTGMVTHYWYLILLPEVTYKFTESINPKWCLYVPEGQMGFKVKSDSQKNVLSDKWESGTMWFGYKALENVTWANFDLLNEDGTLYLAASDPIPVYEKE